MKHATAQNESLNKNATTGNKVMTLTMNEKDVKQAIADYLFERYNIEIPLKQIAVTNSGKDEVATVDLTEGEKQ